MALGLPAPGSADEPALGVEVEGDWRAMRGMVSAGGSVTLRLMDARRVSLRVELPPLGALPEAQLLLRDGEALLLWTEPISARSLIGQDDVLMAPLRRLPASAWLALLTGEGLAAHVEVAERRRQRGYTLLVGTLGGWPVSLRGGKDVARSLRWESPEGTIRLAWRPLPEVRKVLLTLSIDGRVDLRLLLKRPREKKIDPDDWFFSEADANFGEP